MKAIQTIICTVTLLLILWHCAGPESKARSWQSFIPEGYTIRDSVRGDLNLDSIPDFLLVLDSTNSQPAPRPLLLMLFGLADGSWQKGQESKTVVYHKGADGPSYNGIGVSGQSFTVRQEGDSAGFSWQYDIRFRYDSAGADWFLDRTRFEITKPWDTLPLPISGVSYVLSPADFGIVPLSTFNIYRFAAHKKDEILRDPRFIPYNFFELRLIKIPAGNAAFDSIAALKYLFPGRFCRDLNDEEDANIMYWLCESCPKEEIPSNVLFNKEGGEKIIFPDSFGNYTQATGTLTYCEDSIDKIAVFFSTGNDYPGSGSFSAGILGIAVFRKSGNVWLPELFDPTVAAIGAYQYAPPPRQLIRAGNQTFFELNSDEGTGITASYRYCSKYIFGIKSGQPSMIFADPNGTCRSQTDDQTHWCTIVESSDAPIDFPDLKMVTTGHYHKDEEGQAGWERIPWFKKLLQQHPGQDSFDFRVERRFRFNGKKYVEGL